MRCRPEGRSVQAERSALVEEEILLVRHSGEIPEVALHGSLYYLQEQADGPFLQLSAEERQRLERAAAERYEEIILRDLTPANRDSRAFRGLCRAEENWRRFARFCRKSGIDPNPTRRRAATALVRYLLQELDEVAQAQRHPSLNCPPQTVVALAAALGSEPLPPGWEGLCRPA